LIPALAQSTSALINIRAFLATSVLSWIEYRIFFKHILPDLVRQRVGWVERSETHRFSLCNWWVSLRSTHPTDFLKPRPLA
jgi:hypothetical protein